MKELLIALSAILAVAAARPPEPFTIEVYNPNLIGSKVCTWGPAYWCQNITTSSGCNATNHCIKKYWEHMTVEEDNDSVCTICKDMVKQARDQLESNETQEDLKSVFRGSCALMHIKPIVKECDKLVDNFVPELVETLASQMNPSVVCTVAGLCNSAHFDKLLEEFGNGNPTAQPVISLKNDEYSPNECSKCYTIVTHMEVKSKNASQDKFLDRLLDFCGLMGSFSDSCASIVLTYFDEIRERYEKEFNAKNICHLSGKCSDKFHVHEDDEKLKVEIRPLSSVGMVEVSDDLPCKLCEQLVSHLRDLLVANTTETEFQFVLEGICKQTKSFAPECKSIVDEYYPEIYSYLTKQLDGNLVCQIASICPGRNIDEAPVMPLVSEDALRVGLRIMDDKKNTESQQNPEISDMQLPIERMYPTILMSPTMDIEGQQTCALCEYILHYIQEIITNPATEEEVKTIVEKVCTKLPNSIKDNCREFIDVYGSALVAILANQIDPSMVCPKIVVCPSNEVLELLDKIPKEYTLEAEVKEKPTCPLCLLAIEEIYNAIRNNKTEQNIEAELNKLCSHLPKSLNNQCIDLVKGYSKELIEKLLDDMKPQELCTSIKLCNETANVEPPNLFLIDKENEIMTNEIPEYKPIEPIIEEIEPVKMDPECSVCEVVMKYVEKKLSNKSTRDEVEKIIHHICNYVPGHMSDKCKNLVNEYGDIVIELLSNGLQPRQLCVLIKACSVNNNKLKESVTECALCQAVKSEINEFLNDGKTDEEIEEFIAKVCKYVPGSVYDKCQTMMMSYGQSVINIIKRDGVVDKICTDIAMCSEQDFLIMKSTSRIRRETETD